MVTFYYEATRAWENVGWQYQINLGLESIALKQALTLVASARLATLILRS